MYEKDEAGFSLVELLVAMTVTLIVTGAVYGLMSGGQNAFRREPELTDRQQNIRIAMDMIMRDVASAGAGMPPFIQTFARGLDGNTLGTVSPVAPSGARTDELEIMGNPNNFEMEPACDYPGGSSTNVRLAAGRTAVTGTTATVMILMAEPGVSPPRPDGHWTMRAINGGVNYPNAGDGNCEAGQPHANLQSNSGGDQTGWNLPGGICGGNWDGSKCDPAPGNACIKNDGTARTNQQCKTLGIIMAEIIRYRIRVGTDGIPNLERFSSASTANFSGGNPSVFQVVARGIDDLQVRYRQANGTETVDEGAPAVDQTQANYNTIIDRVTVTLSSRAEGRNIQGMTTAASPNPRAVRGTLTSQITPRAALITLGTPVANRRAGWTGPEWY